METILIILNILILSAITLVIFIFYQSKSKKDLEKQSDSHHQSQELQNLKSSFQNSFGEMSKEIAKLNFKEPSNILISNVTGKEILNSNELKDLLVKQIESRVRWRESIMLRIEKGVTQFIEIGPGKVLSGLVKRIDKSVKVSAINTEEDTKLININE